MQIYAIANRRFAAAWIVLSLVTVMVILGASTPVSAALPKAFTASYSIHVKGAKVAKMERQLAPQADGQLLFESKTRTSGLVAMFKKVRVVEQSLAEVHEGTLRPKRYHYDRMSGDKQKLVTVEFDWEKGKIANIVKEHTWHLDTAPGILDKMLYHVVLMRDLASGKRELEYKIADGGKIKTYRFEVIAEENLNTSLGELATLKLQRIRSDSKRKQTFWCAPALHFVPVRVDSEEKDGSITTAKITAFSGWQPLELPQPELGSEPGSDPVSTIGAESGAATLHQVR
jgi:hypothetical protein